MKRKTRRHFLKEAGVVSLGFAAQANAETRVIGFAPQEAWTLHGEQFRHRGRPKGGWVQNFTSTVEALHDDQWRIWGGLSVPETGFRNIGFHEGRVGGEWRSVLAVCSTGEPDPNAELAIGGIPEGAHPIQVVTIRLQNGRTRLYFWAHGKGLVRYLAADSLDESATRFQVVNAATPCLYHPGDRAVGGAAAEAAGLKRYASRVAKPEAGEPLAPAELISNDSTNVYQLEDGTFEMYSVALMEVSKDDPRYAPRDNLKGFLRVIDRYTSSDGLNWGNRQRVLSPDSHDPIDQQMYYLSVTHSEKGLIGLLGSYRLNSQTIDLEPCFSNDGITWERPHRKPWVPRAKPGESLGSYMLHAPHNLVQRNGRWWIFYTGGNFSHNNVDSHGPPNRAVFAASCDSVWG
ncbi:MAG: hypothetical protein P1U87_17250 [Verrucomicrobiales bacterium]|nr:hypothetical protein [Verrucomicrobiales bacterium]